MSVKDILDKMLGVQPPAMNQADLDKMILEHAKFMKAMGQGAPVPQSLLDDLNKIQKERNEIARSKRLDVFKKLPSHIRERITDQYAITDAIQKMNNCTPELDNEEYRIIREIRDLDKQHYAGVYHHGAGAATAPGTPDIIIPGVTYEDIRKAHFEATAEEELTNNSTESKDS